MNTNQIKRCKPKYTLEFKQDAARLVLEKGYTHQQAADNLGYHLVQLVAGSEQSEDRQQMARQKKLF
jgi:transposase